MKSAANKRRRSRYTEEVHDESEPWLVSYADLMTLLLGFFIILYSMSSLDEKKFNVITDAVSGALGKDSSRVSEVLKKDSQEIPKQEYERMMYLLSKLNLGSLAELAVATENARKSDDLKRKFSEIIGTSSDKPDELFEVILPNNIVFQRGSVTVSAAARKDLLKIAEKIKVAKLSSRVTVTGHTDTTPPGAATASIYGDNLGVSAARAAAVGSVLQSFGVPANMIDATGKGSSEPLFPEFDARGRQITENMQRNRRIHIVLKLK